MEDREGDLNDPFGWLNTPHPFSQPDPFTPLFDALYAFYVTGEGEPPPVETTPRTVRAVSAVDVLTAHGILRAPEVVALAAEEKLDLAAAVTMLVKESGGGRNVWGSDGVNTAGTYTKGAPVTKAAYLAYKQAVQQKRAGRQGVGPCQLTYGPFQDQADALGGCWDWRCNVRIGFRVLAQGIRASGLRTGFRSYNGSGPAAERYAEDALAKYATWKTRLAGVTTEPAPSAPPTAAEEDEMGVMPWTLPAGQNMECIIPVPVFDRDTVATLWMTTGWTDATFRGLYFVRDRGPGLSPQQEQWGGAGPFTLVQNDRPSWPLPAGCTSIGAMYDSDHEISCLVVYPPI